MRHISLTPFGRQPVTAGLLATNALAEAPAPEIAPDKWSILRNLTAARRAYGVSDRDLAVLSALLSFHPMKELVDDDRLIVFPSNASLSERAHGMAESTLRRHLAALVRAGLILRRDSPNGKRYATRGGGGLAFGFDLRPLLVRSPQIASQAADARAEALTRRRLREAAVIHLRDTAKLLQWCIESGVPGLEAQHANIALLQRALRRKLEVDALATLAHNARELSDRVRGIVPIDADETRGDDSQNERHQQNSNIIIIESESCHEKQERQVEVPPALPLGIVLKAVPDLLDYAPDGIRHWRDLVRTCEFVRPMLGITPDAWHRACRIMSPEVAAVTLACILQRSGQIARPGGYLRMLTAKAEAGCFSPGPMVMALVRSENARPS